MRDSAKVMEQGFEILDLRSENAALREQIVQLSQAQANSSDVADQRQRISELESQLERQRLDFLAAERDARVANNALVKVKRDLPDLKAKLSASEKARKALQALNPERLKKQLNDQKAKVAEAKQAASAWQQKLTDERKQHDSELDDIKRTLRIMLSEVDYFAESATHYCTLSRFAFPDDAEKAPLRIRVTDRRTSVSSVLLDVVDGEPKFSTDIFDGKLCDQTKATLAREFQSISETGTVSAEASEAYNARRESI